MDIRPRKCPVGFDLSDLPPKMGWTVLFPAPELVWIEENSCFDTMEHNRPLTEKAIGWQRSANDKLSLDLKKSPKSIATHIGLQRKNKQQHASGWFCEFPFERKA
jgi:hypothetical protein